MCIRDRFKANTPPLFHPWVESAGWVCSVFSTSVTWLNAVRLKTFMSISIVMKFFFIKFRFISFLLFDQPVQVYRETLPFKTKKKQLLIENFFVNINYLK